MNKKILALLCLFLTTAIYAQTDKIKHCPSAAQLELNGPPIAFFLKGVNDEGKNFESKPFGYCNYCDVTFVVEKINEEITSYNPDKKELACAYNGYFEQPGNRKENKVVIVSNFGEY